MYIYNYMRCKRLIAKLVVSLSWYTCNSVCLYLKCTQLLCSLTQVLLPCTDLSFPLPPSPSKTVTSSNALQIVRFALASPLILARSISSGTTRSFATFELIKTAQARLLYCVSGAVVRELTALTPLSEIQRTYYGTLSAFVSEVLCLRVVLVVYPIILYFEKVCTSIFWPTYFASTVSSLCSNLCTCIYVYIC